MAGLRRRRANAYDSGYEGKWAPYVPVHERRAAAVAEVTKLKKKGQTICPVRVSGTKLTQTFWGNAWCRNLEAYSDFSNRLPRGRTYLRNGSVVDLQILAGKVTALVRGSSMYEIAITIAPVEQERWKVLRSHCAGQLGSLVDLLQGKLSNNVMEVISRQETGLFPAPKQIKMSCSCPDWAVMCKHVASALYGVGIRLDEQPELLFLLRGVDHTELLAEVATSASLAKQKPATKTLTTEDLASVFGIELEADVEQPVARVPKKKTKKTKKKPKPRAKKSAQKRGK